MIRNLSIFFVLGFVSLTAAQGQATRTWVSGVIGDDANPCSRPAPYKTFAGAISKTAAGGEIDVTDPGGFGSVTITKSITIDAGGIFAGVLTPGMNGITISAGLTDTVTLRGLNISGQGTGLSGVTITSAGTVHIEKSRISGFTTGGVVVEPGSSTPALALTINGTEVHDCTGNTASGIALLGGSWPVNADLEDVRVYGCATGLHAATASKVAARNVDFSFDNIGVSAAGNAVVDLDTGLFSHDTTAVQAAGNSLLLLSNNSIFENVTGLSSTGGTIASFANNRVRGNGTNGRATVTEGLR